MTRVAVVTGSSSGIGRATALALADAGYAIVLHAKSSLAKLQEVARELQARNCDVRCVLADIADEASCRLLVQTAFAWHSRVYAWINNAGADVLTAETGAWDFQRKLDLLWSVDVRGTIQISRLVGQAMQAQPPGELPTIINIGWDQALQGMEGESGQLFCTVKSAVMAFSHSLAQTLAPHVRVNCVAPGWVRTAWGTQASPYWSRRAQSESLLERWGRPEDVAHTIRWLASHESEFVNGQCISVNGGWRRGDPANIDWNPEPK